MQDVVHISEEITDKVNLIYEDSIRQLDSAKEITISVHQIAEVIHSNSAASEQSAASSSELSSQAENLKELVKTFKLNELYMTV